MPERHSGQVDVFLELLESARNDDEPTTAEEDRSVREAWDEYRCGERALLKRLLHDLS
jgi:hypothetical protein